MNSLINTPEWQALSQHQADIASQHMRDWFRNEPDRINSHTIWAGAIRLDYSRNLVTPETLRLLANLVQPIHLQEKIQALFTGSPVNTTEDRPALHTALRDKTGQPIIINGIDIAPEIRQTHAAMAAFTTAIHSGTWLGSTGKPIRHIVNLGIGGSGIGPKMAVEALKDFAISNLRFHFISSVDKAKINDVLSQIDPETTLFIISSKTFTTLETLTNAETILDWMNTRLDQNVLARHFIAITAAPDKAVAFGLPAGNVFPIWDWVGGRYSIWSAIGLPLMLMLGAKQFNEFLDGAYDMDQHFRNTASPANMPVLLALLDIWYVNFFHARAHAIVPYAYRLRHLVTYLQQAEMESNGKSVGLTGNTLTYATSPVIFGEEGCNGQHTYHQLLHQGQHLIPVDFIFTDRASEADKHHDIMNASGLSQAQALMHGKTTDETYQELLASGYPEHQAKHLAPHKMIPGNRPSNIIYLTQLNPYNLGSLLALYEHKIFVTGAIWNINSFDQWGVELGKQLLPAILRHMQTETG